MIHRNICPICGSENPEGSEFCQVCKANLNALPDSIYPTEAEPIEQELTPEIEAENKNTDEDLDLDRPVPIWLKSKMVSSEKKPMDFDAFSDMLFGVSDKRKVNQPVKAVRQQSKKTVSVYQPPLQYLNEPPLIEPDENTKDIPEEIPGIADFLLQRPARKWEDRKPQPPVNKGSSVSLLTDFSKERPAKKWDDQRPEENITSDAKGTGRVSQPLLWWQQDPPLVETNDPNDADVTKNYDTDDTELDHSTSPTKVANAAAVFGAVPDQEESETVSDERYEEYQPESGSLLSDLMNEINSNSGSLTPSEQRENQNGTVFYSGNEKPNAPAPQQDTDIAEISISDPDNAASAEMLDRILRNIGYEVEGEPKPEEQHPEKPEKGKEPESENDGNDKTPSKENTLIDRASGLLKPLRGFFIPEVIDNPLIPDDDDLLEKDIDPYGLNEKVSEKDETLDEQDIPWDLFGTADMALPQSPEDPAYRTFSRSGIPEDPGSTTYQERMISSILGKIIQAENYVRPNEEKNNREISITARLFLAALAIIGVIIILNTGLTDRLDPPAVPSASESLVFYNQAENATGNALVVIDYTPAYNAVMNSAVNSLLGMLENNAEKVYLAALNPAAMPNVQQILNKHANKVEFAGWWPGGIISIRSRLANSKIPDHIWLLTSEITSVRYWAEQLSVSEENYQLHVMAPGQLEPLLKPYLQAQMITDMLSRDSDLTEFGQKSHTANRTQMAVWYLTALIPLAWLCGIIGKVMKAEPNYGRKSNVKSEELQQQEEEKGDENDGKL